MICFLRSFVVQLYLIKTQSWASRLTGLWKQDIPKQKFMFVRGLWLYDVSQIQQPKTMWQQTRKRKHNWKSFTEEGHEIWLKAPGTPRKPSVKISGPSECCFWDSCMNDFSPPDRGKLQLSCRDEKQESTPWIPSERSSWTKVLVGCEFSPDVSAPDGSSECQSVLTCTEQFVGDKDSPWR